MTEAGERGAKEEAAADGAAPAAEKPRVPLDAFFGVKAGMTRVFDGDGDHVPVTVIGLVPNVVVQVKTRARDGYGALQVGFGEKRASLVTRPVAGRLGKAGTGLGVTRFAEVRTPDDPDASVLGALVSYERFAPGALVDATGVSKGKGFQGVIKRHGFSGGPGAHGSKFHRAPGSIGNNSQPSRVFKNKRMPGRMGAARATVKNLRVVDLDEERGFLLLKGAVAGGRGGFVRLALARRPGTAGG